LSVQVNSAKKRVKIRPQGPQSKIAKMKSRCSFSLWLIHHFHHFLQDE
jgi:hypothetical protein